MSTTDDDDFREVGPGRTRTVTEANHPVLVYRSLHPGRTRKDGTPGTPKERIGLSISGEVFSKFPGKTPRFSIEYSKGRSMFRIREDECGRIEVFEPRKGDRRVFRIEPVPEVRIRDSDRYKAAYFFGGGALYVEVPINLLAAPAESAPGHGAPPNALRVRPGVVEVVEKIPSKPRG